MAGAGDGIQASRTAPGRRARPARRVLAAALLGIALVVACNPDDDAPPTNPLDEGPATTAVATTPPVMTTGSLSPSATAPAALESTEAATARAITLFAEWLGIPETEFNVVAAEAINWTDSCLGVDFPGITCAEVITPGYRVALRDFYQNQHLVHLDTTGGAVWPGQMTDEGILVDVQPTSGRVRVEADGDILIFRLAPGSATPGVEGGAQALEPGTPVAVSFDGAPDGNEPPVIASLVPLE